MLRKLFRAIFTIVGGIIGYGAFLLSVYLLSITDIRGGFSMTQWQEIGAASVFVIIFGLIFFKLSPLFNKRSKRVAKNIETDLQRFSGNEILSALIGLVIGLLLAFLISQIYVFVKVPYLPTVLTVITYLVCAYIGVVVVSRNAKDALGAIMSQRRIQSVGGSKNKGNDATPKILDTSVIIDGRIADIMSTGFMEGKIVIPEFVLVELRHIADSSDSLKRNRGRRGLDILNKIQAEYGVDIYDTTGEKGLDEIPEVDVKLLKLAQNMNGKVVTNDFNLNKVAGIKGVAVLNINELANTLKPAVLPGEDISLFLVKEGKENRQAVAYLDDGTMIVVEEGQRFIGKTINVTVTSVLQTSAGRMIFGKPSKKNV